MADTASVLFQLMASNETGPAIASAVADTDKLAAAQSAVTAASDESVAAQEAAQERLNAFKLTAQEQLTQKMAAVETAAYAEADARAKESADVQAESSAKGGEGGSGLKGMAEAAGVFALGEGIKGAVEAADKANVTYAQTAAVLKSTGDASGLTADQIKNLSDKYGELDGVQGITVQSALNQELANKGVQAQLAAGSITADQMTQTTLNMAAAMSHGTDTSGSMSAAASALTKALADPFTATKALTGVGAQLTASQVAQLAALKKTNDVAGAQKLIMDALTSATAGQAAAAATPAQKLGAQLDDLKVTIGEKLLPVVEKMTDDLMEVINFVEAHSTVFGLLASVIGAVGGAILVVIGAQKAWNAVQEITDALMEANPIGIIIVALAGLAAGIYYAYTHFQDFRNGMNDVWDVIKTVFGWVKSNWPLLLAILTGPTGIAVYEIQQHWDDIKNGVVDMYDAVKGAFTDVVNWVKGVPAKIVSALGDLATLLYNKGKDVIQGLWNGDKYVMGQVFSYFENLPMNVLHAFGNVDNLLYNAGKAVIQGFINGVEGMFGSVASTLGNLTSKLTSWKGPPGTDATILHNAGQLVIGGFINGLESKYGDVHNSLGGLTNSLSGSIGSSINIGGGVSVQNQHTLSISMDFTGAGTDAMVTALRKAVRLKGGNVQAVLGAAA